MSDTKVKSLQDRQKEIGLLFKGYRKRTGLTRRQVVLKTKVFTINRLTSIENGNGKLVTKEEVEAFYTKCFLFLIDTFREILLPEGHTQEEWDEYVYKLNCDRLGKTYEKDRKNNKKAQRSRK